MTPRFPPCRHRCEPRTRSLYYCRSPKLAGLKLITAVECNRCPYVDHHCPGDGDEVRPDVHPEMSAERLAALLEGPPLPWPPDWGDWEVTQRAHRLAAERFLADLPPYPEGRFHGRGVVIAGGGAAYFPSLFVTVRAVRHVGCTLPIQVWYLGRENELPPEHRSLLERFGVECVDADEARRRYPCRILNGWELKGFAVLHSPFEEVLSLDADCYPVQDPFPLFEDADYRTTGAIFWPDLPGAPPLDWRPFGLAPSCRVSIESGQFLVNKRLCWQPLQLAWWYNDHSDWSYLHGFGDKHTFEVAWARCRRRYTMFRQDVECSSYGFKHVGPEGQLLFVHRCNDKFRFGTPDYISPQSFMANHFHPELPFETECFTWLRELRSEREVEAARTRSISPDRLAPVKDQSPSLRAFMYTCPERRPVWEATMERWGATDWGEAPIVVVDDGTGSPHGGRHVATARRMLAVAAEQGAEYCLFLEDDLLFNLYLRHNLLRWPPLRDRELWMGSLYNPGLAPTAGTGEADLWQLRSVLVPCAEYYGSQAVVLSRAAITASLDEWEAPGLLDHKLAAIASRHSAGVVLHLPSLVQHVPVPSTWGGAYHRAANFDPFYRA